MSSKLIKLILALAVAIALGYFSYPLFYGETSGKHRQIAQIPTNGTPKGKDTSDVPPETPQPSAPTEISDGASDDDWQKGFEETSDQQEEEETTAENDTSEGGDNSFMFTDGDPDLRGITEEKDAPEVAGQTDVVPPALTVQREHSIVDAAKNLANAFQQQAKKPTPPQTKPEFDAEAWKQPQKIYKTVMERVLQKLGDKPTPESILSFLGNAENRSDIALISLCRKAGLSDLKDVASRPMGGKLLETLSSDPDWLCNTMFSGPVDKLGRGLMYMETIFQASPQDMMEPISRRIATTAATEFAREGWDKEGMLARYNYYNTSYKEGKLNKAFNSLKYWETRFITGNREHDTWGSPQSLAWERDNVRLPLERYLDASSQLHYRMKNAFGDSVHGPDYLAPVRAAMGNITPLMHREIGGVCGACSHYGAYAALAAGIPAMTMGEPGHCAYTVRVNNDWKKGYTIFWQHSMHKTFWNLHDWEFLILAQKLYEDRENTLVSDHLAAVADLLAARRFTRAAIECFNAATVVQPLNWPAWQAEAGFLKQKAPKNKANWTDLCLRVSNTMAENFHDAAATFLARYVYPQLLPLVPNLKERNKLFAAFFNKCNDYGVHHWDIAPLLNAQFEGCRTDAEKLDYMKTALSVLMSKPDYSGSVLAWGLDAAGRSAGEEEGQKNSHMQEEFSKLIISAMSHMRASKKDQNATWNGLGEAMCAAENNNDERTFQAIGKLAMQKCKKNFPKYKFKFKSFSGKVISTKGLIQTTHKLNDAAVRDGCLHWGVLQKTGGSIPMPAGGDGSVSVKMDEGGQINGVVILFDKPIEDGQNYTLETSEDGQNWSKTNAEAQLNVSVMRFDLQEHGINARYVRLVKAGSDKNSTTNLVGFYVYGKPNKSKS